MHLVSVSQRLLFSHQLTPTLTLGLSLRLGLGLAWGHFQHNFFFVYTSFKDLSLNVYDDADLFHLVSDFQRLSFPQVLTPTLTLELRLGLGLGLAWGHLQDKKCYIYTSLKDFSPHGYDQTHVFHLVSSSQLLSFFQELAWGHFQNKYFLVYTSFKDFSLNVYDDTSLLHLLSVSQRLSNSQELTLTLTLSLTLGLGLGLNPNPNPKLNPRVRVGVNS